MISADSTSASLARANAGAIIAASAAVAGVIVAALLGALQQRAQSKREAARQQAAWDREDARRARAERADAYAQMLHAADTAAIDRARIGVALLTGLTTRELRDEMAAAYDHLLVPLSRVRLFGSPEAAHHARALYTALFEALQGRGRSVADPAQVSYAEIAEKYANESLVEFLNVARRDLGAEPLPADQPSAEKSSAPPDAASA